MIQLRRQKETLSGELTPAEKAALHLVAVEYIRNNVDTDQGDDATGVAATIASQGKKRFLIEAIITDCYCFYVTACGVLDDERITIPEETLKEVGPTASASKLLTMRHDFLTNLPNP